MKLGIIGLPSSGKTTIFNALTKGDAPTGQSMGGRFDVLTAVVDVLDPRVDILTNMFKPKKTTYARITYSDVAGLQKGGEEGSALGGAILNHLSALDGFVHVVRAFESDLVPHPDGSVNAARDLEAQLGQARRRLIQGGGLDITDGLIDPPGSRPQVVQGLPQVLGGGHDHGSCSTVALERCARVTFAEAYRSDGPTSSASISMTVRFSPSFS